MLYYKWLNSIIFREYTWYDFSPSKFVKIYVPEIVCLWECSTHIWIECGFCYCSVECSIHLNQIKLVNSVVQVTYILMIFFCFSINGNLAFFVIMISCTFCILLASWDNAIFIIVGFLINAFKAMTFPLDITWPVRQFLDI